MNPFSWFSFTNNSRISDLARRKKDSNSINPRSNGMVDVTKQVREEIFPRHLFYHRNLCRMIISLRVDPRGRLESQMRFYTVPPIWLAIQPYFHLPDQ